MRLMVNFRSQLVRLAINCWLCRKLHCDFCHKYVPSKIICSCPPKNHLWGNSESIRPHYVCSNLVGIIFRCLSLRGGVVQESTGWLTVGFLAEWIIRFVCLNACWLVLCILLHLVWHLASAVQLYMFKIWFWHIWCNVRFRFLIFWPADWAKK